MNSEKPLRYLITKGELTPENFEQRKGEVRETIRAAVRAGLSMIQVREKRITARQLYELSRESADIVSGSGTKLLVNGRADIAIASGADGVHIPEVGLPIADVRRSFPSPILIAASVHGINAARAAQTDGADFVVFGPVFDSGEKKGKGIEELAEVCRALPGFPVIAVGGIDQSNYADVLEVGSAGYAAIRYLNAYVRAF